ncbi:actin-related protein 5 [Cimex lectularius]|uniref:Actin-related protein 5 n=1 Tax=Cimex lectularius TaxID=79782 RepID=A0A8I6S9U3_CIMLE|nr:actin-related protein 5 [Cimex lectularius]
MDILEFKDVKPVPDQFHPYTESLKNDKVPIIIDNGSYNCRVGWATMEKPLLVFKNVLAKSSKSRREKSKKDNEIQIGNDISNIEAIRFQLKTQFDRNVVTHMEVQEHILNYAFSHLSIDTDNCVNHPIVMTEALLNPNYSRMLMSELLFECYTVPSVCYCVDSLASYWRKPSENSTSLLVDLGYSTCHVIPIINGNFDANQLRRLDLGGQHITSYLHRLLQLKYPAHFTSINLSRAEELLHNHCHVATNYMEELSNWSDPEYYDANVRCIQLPFNYSTSTLTPEQQKERRKELARRLIEINARKREEKLAEDEEQLNQLLAIQDLKDEGEMAEFQNAIAEIGLNSTDELTKLINQVQLRIERTRQKIANTMANNMEDPIAEDTRQKIPKQFQTPKCEEDFKTWVESVRKKREELLEKRAVRRQRRQDMAKRRTLASVERMRLISQLAANNEKRDDDFGSRDEDWDVYKAINKEGDSDSEGESEKLLELEEVLRAHDPTFLTYCPNNATQGGEAPAESYRLHVGIETIRAPEALFSPYLIGSMQAGISDVIAWVIKQYPNDIAEMLSKDVCLTGGLARIPGIKDRILSDLIEVRPFKSEINVRILPTPSFGAWKGCKMLAGSADFTNNFITREEYYEKGGDYLREHCASNVFTPSPLSLAHIEAHAAKPDYVDLDQH